MLPAPQLSTETSFRNLITTNNAIQPMQSFSVIHLVKVKNIVVHDIPVEILFFESIISVVSTPCLFLMIVEKLAMDRNFNHHWGTQNSCFQPRNQITNLKGF